MCDERIFSGDIMNALHQSVERKLRVHHTFKLSSLRHSIEIASNNMLQYVTARLAYWNILSYHYNTLCRLISTVPVVYVRK